MFALFALLALAEAKDGFSGSNLRRLSQPATEKPKSEGQKLKEAGEKAEEVLDKVGEVADTVKESLKEAEGWLVDYAGKTPIGEHCIAKYEDDGMVKKFEWFACMLCAVFDGLSGTIKISILSGLIVYLVVSTITLILRCFCCCI